MLQSGPLATGSGRLSERIGSAQVSTCCTCSPAGVVLPPTNPGATTLRNQAA